MGHLDFSFAHIGEKTYTSCFSQGSNKKLCFTFCIKQRLVQEKFPSVMDRDTSVSVQDTEQNHAKEVKIIDVHLKVNVTV